MRDSRASGGSVLLVSKMQSVKAHKPTFIGLGAQKCASTWLYRVLQEHPDIVVSAEKELDFFSHRIDHGYEWYEQHFATETDCAAYGEISPSYFCDADAPKRVFKYNPKMKIIVSFRDPIERLLSNHRHEVRAGHLTSGDLSLEAGLANNPMYVEQSMYATHLQRWLECFPDKQMFCVLMEDIKENPQKVAKELYTFVGADDTFATTGERQRYNESYANRSQALKRVKDVAYSMSTKRGFSWLWNLGRVTGARSVYRKINRMPSNDVIPQPSEKTIRALREQFAPEVEQLARLLGRPLDSWR